MLPPVFSLLLCLSISVAALSVPQIQPGVAHRAVEVLTSPLPATATNFKAEPATIKAEPTTTKTVTTQAFDDTPSFLVGTQTGQGTFYATGLGACGIINQDSDHIAAVSHLLFDAFPGYNHVNPDTNPVCGKQVSVSYGGNSVTVTITDRCEACALTDLDFSPAAFEILADPSIGRLDGITWHWLD